MINIKFTQLVAWVFLIILGAILLPISLMTPLSPAVKDTLYYAGILSLTLGGVMAFYQLIKDFIWNPKHGKTPEDE